MHALYVLGVWEVALEHVLYALFVMFCLAFKSSPTEACHPELTPELKDFYSENRRVADQNYKIRKTGRIF